MTAGVAGVVTCRQSTMQALDVDCAPKPVVVAADAGGGVR